MEGKRAEVGHGTEPWVQTKPLNSAQPGELKPPTQREPSLFRSPPCLKLQPSAMQPFLRVFYLVAWLFCLLNDTVLRDVCIL